jgi:predicted fused transcriptional regulator/phosphomethylpyrimidine kinase
MMQISEEKKNIINQIREAYSFISKGKAFSKLIPEVRMNISGSLSNAKNKSEIAGIEGRITIINGFPKASGEIKFGVSDHTARLILTAKEFDNSVNFVINLKYIPELIESIKKDTKLELQEIIREEQPESVKEREYSTMQWLIKESVKKKGKIPDIIWDKGAIGKEPMMRLFGKNSTDLIRKLEQIIRLVKKDKI